MSSLYSGNTQKQVTDQQRERVCGRKGQYWSEADALDAGARRPGYVRAYRCPFCRNWHLTHTRKGGAIE